MEWNEIGIYRETSMHQTFPWIVHHDWSHLQHLTFSLIHHFLSPPFSSLPMKMSKPAQFIKCVIGENYFLLLYFQQCADYWGEKKNLWWQMIRICNDHFRIVWNLIIDCNWLEEKRLNCMNFRLISSIQLHNHVRCIQYSCPYFLFQ